MLLPTFLAAIPDHRRPQGRLYGLEHLLLFSILAILSDATSYRKIQRFIDARLPQLNALCGLRWKRAPAHTAIRHARQGVGPAAVGVAFRGHAAVPDGPREGLAGTAPGGKTPRGSFGRFRDQRALQTSSALTAGRPPVPGQVSVGAAGKPHEIPAARQPVNELGQPGRPFTPDAPRCRKKRLNPSPPPAAT